MPQAQMFVCSRPQFLRLHVTMELMSVFHFPQITTKQQMHLLPYCNQLIFIPQAIYLCPCIIHNESILMSIALEHKGAITIKRTKKHIEQLSKLNKNCNVVRFIFVVPL
jgi:hypothetical protein